MDLYKLAGLEYGYETKDLWELINSYPVAQRTFEQGKQIRSYSPVVVFVNHEGAFHYTLKTEGKDYLRFHFHVESESVWDTRCGPPLEKMPWDAFRERPLLLRNGPRAAALAALYLVTLTVRNVLEPRLLGAQAGLPPILSLLAMYLGYCAFGVTGMLICPFLLLLGAQLRRQAKK